MSCACAENWQTQALPSPGRSQFPSSIRGAEIGDGFKADIVVAGELILEIKAVSTILPIHAVQLRTYLRMSGIHVGLLLNFNEPRLVDGLRRYVV